MSFAMLNFLPLIFVVLSAVGLIVLTLGVRGQPVFSQPRCAKCSYDLRGLPFMTPDQLGACPECGAALGEVGAVSFGQWRRRPKRIIFGVLLLALPWVVGLPLMFMLRSRAFAAAAPGFANRSTQSTSAILTNLKVPANVDAPWDWQELERRVRGGTLTAQDSSTAVAALIAHLQAQRAAGKSQQPLSWSNGFLKAAIARGDVNSQQLAALCQAFYGSTAMLTLRSVQRQGDPIFVEQSMQSPWNLEGMQMVWALNSVTADGTTKLTPKLRYESQANSSHPDQFSGNGNNGYLSMQLAQSLPPGEHEIAFTYDFGTLSQTALMRGIDGKPGTVDKWPAPSAKWQGVIKKKVTIVAKDQPAVKVVTDPSGDPFASFSIDVAEAIARPSLRGTDIAIKWKVDGRTATPVAYRVEVRAGDLKIPFGTFMYSMTRGGTSSSYSEHWATKKPLPPDVTHLDIVMTPDTKVAEQSVNIEQIWGKPHEILDVPLQRFDLENGGESTTRPAPATSPATTRAVVAAEPSGA